MQEAGLDINIDKTKMLDQTRRDQGDPSIVTVSYTHLDVYKRQILRLI